jgi:integrase
MRIGDAWRLQWTDTDFVASTLRVTPEKGSNPRIFKISSKLVAMLTALQNRSISGRIFGKWLKSEERPFSYQRKSTANKLQNPKILKISFHTFRHFKATMEYHKTRDILHITKIPGHKNINNRLVYTQLIDLSNDEYVSRVAKTMDEVRKLVESGFE